ncbi:hypothetical protein FOCC_FOCC008549 [Frankliniella occidentalis]|nr:hypothetical protein FOCC_FOCC008549 [Frankliniella occidentalis]
MCRLLTWVNTTALGSGLDSPGTPLAPLLLLLDCLPDWPPALLAQPGPACPHPSRAAGWAGPSRARRRAGAGAGSGLLPEPAAGRAPVAPQDQVDTQAQLAARPRRQDRQTVGQTDRQKGRQAGGQALEVGSQPAPAIGSRAPGSSAAMGCSLRRAPRSWSTCLLYLRTIIAKDARTMHCTWLQPPVSCRRRGRGVAGRV